MKKIGIDARMYAPNFTGIGRYVYELLSHIAEADDENEYLFFFNEPEYSNFRARRHGIKKILAEAPIYSFAEQTKFLMKLFGARLDLMHFTHFNAPVFYRRPNIVTIHDLTLSFFPGKKMNKLHHRIGYQWSIRSVVAGARHIISASAHTKTDLMRLLKVPEEKISVIHEGVNSTFHQINDRSLLEDFRTRIGLNNPFILYTGNWRDHKNLVNLIKAFAIARERFGIPHYLAITGKDDPWYPEVKDTVKKLQLEGFVRFTGFVPDEELVLLYNAADAYAFPSLYEGFGLPALEAFASGTPVAASNISSLPEVCADAALYFDPKNPQDMARVLADICLDRKKRKELIKRGFARVKQFSWKRMAEETLKIYKKALI